MLSVSGKTRVSNAYARACAPLGYVHNQLRLQGLDPAAPNDGLWKGTLSGPERGAFELRLPRSDRSVFAAVIASTDRFEQDRDPLGAVFRKRPLGVEAERGELDTVVSVDRTLASRGIDLVALCEPKNASRHSTSASGRESLPPRYRYKRNLRVYLKKVQWQIWPK